MPNIEELKKKLRENRSKSENESQQKDKELKGIEGFLFFILFSLIISFWTGNFDFSDLTNKSNPIQTILYVALVIFQIIIIILFLFEQKLVPILMIIYCCIPFAAAIKMLFEVITNPEIPGYAFILQLLKMVFSCLIIGYFLKSKRVKNTFIN